MLHERRYWEESDSGACNGMAKYNVMRDSSAVMISILVQVAYKSSRVIHGTGMV
jgi:hypothetical protein